MTAVFTEDWFCEESCAALADLFRNVADRPGCIVEIGSWEGRSTIALANAAYPQVVDAVDTWEGSPGEVSAKLAKERDVFAAFQENIEVATMGNVRAHRKDWRAFFAEQVLPVKFCFIDATHTYEEVRDNIAAALRVMAPGGIICGDDAHHPPIQQAVLELLPDATRIATLWWARV